MGDREYDDKIYIDKGAYNSLLRNDNTNYVAPASPTQEPHTGRNSAGGLYRPLGFSTYSNSSYAWRPRHSTLSPKATKSMRESYHGYKVDSTRTDEEIDPTQTKILSSPIKVVLHSSFTNSSVDAHNTYGEVYVKDVSPNVHPTIKTAKQIMTVYIRTRHRELDHQIYYRRVPKDLLILFIPPTCETMLCSLKFKHYKENLMQVKK